MCKSLAQVNIGAALFTGLVFGALALDTNDQTALSFEVNAKLVEFGNNLVSLPFPGAMARSAHANRTFVLILQLGPQVLFFAGLSCDAGALLTNRGPVLIIGTGYLLVTVGIFALIGWGTGLCVGIGSTIFFGVACSLSSRQLMTEHLDRVHQEKTMHGRLLQGIALYQDFIAVLAFTILYAFQRTLVDLDEVAPGYNVTAAANATSAARRAGDASNATASNGTAYAGKNPWVPVNVWHDRFTLGDEIGKALGIVALFAVVFALLNRYVLKSLFHFFTTDGEMLFIGTMAYNFGAAALCYQAGVSPIVGSFFAGFSLSQLPSRVQIQNKVSARRPPGCIAARDKQCG